MSGPTCVCGSTDYHVRLQGRYDRLGFDGYPFTIAECSGCGLARTFPVPDATQYEHGYSMTTQDGAYVGGPDGWSERRARWIAARAPRGRLLDVGCGSGNLVEAALALGFDAEGIDLDPIAAEAGQRLGRPVRAAELADVEGQYEVIILAHVLEHVADPAESLRHVARLLAPNGRAFVFVPNRAGLFPRLIGERWLGWVPHQHVWHFTPRTLARTVDRTLLHVTSSVSRGAIEPPSNGARGVAKAAVAAFARFSGWGDELVATIEQRA